MLWWTLRQMRSASQETRLRTIARLPHYRDEQASDVLMEVLYRPASIREFEAALKAAEQVDPNRSVNAIVYALLHWGEDYKRIPFEEQNAAENRVLDQGIGVLRRIDPDAAIRLLEDIAGSESSSNDTVEQALKLLSMLADSSSSREASILSYIVDVFARRGLTRKALTVLSDRFPDWRSSSRAQWWLQTAKMRVNKRFEEWGALPEYHDAEILVELADRSAIYQLVLCIASGKGCPELMHAIERIDPCWAVSESGVAGIRRLLALAAAVDIDSQKRKYREDAIIALGFIPRGNVLDSAILETLNKILAAGNPNVCDRMAAARSLANGWGTEVINTLVSQLPEHSQLEVDKDDTNTIKTIVDLLSGLLLTEKGKQAASVASLEKLARIKTYTYVDHHLYEMRADEKTIDMEKLTILAREELDRRFKS